MLFLRVTGGFSLEWLEVVSFLYPPWWLTFTLRIESVIQSASLKEMKRLKEMCACKNG